MKDKSSIGLAIVVIFSKLVFLAVVVYIIYHFAGIGYSYGYQIFNQTAVTSEGEGRIAVVTITQEDDASDIAEQLENKGLIEDANLFYWQERFSEYHGEELPGTYTLSTTMTPEEMIAAMSTETQDTLDESINADNAISDQAYEEDAADEDTASAEGDEGMPEDGTE